MESFRCHSQSNFIFCHYGFLQMIDKCRAFIIYETTIVRASHQVARWCLSPLRHGEAEVRGQNSTDAQATLSSLGLYEKNYILFTFCLVITIYLFYFLISWKADVPKESTRNGYNYNTLFFFYSPFSQTNCLKLTQF